MFAVGKVEGEAQEIQMVVVRDHTVRLDHEQQKLIPGLPTRILPQDLLPSLSYEAL
jgi:hypothetical protein